MTRDLACGRASCTSSGSAWTRPTRPSRPRSPRQRDQRRDAVRADGRPAARARPARSTRRSAHIATARRRRPRPPDRRAGADRRRVTRRASRTPSGACSAGAARRTCRATGLGPVEAIAAIRAAGGLPALAHFGEAPRGSRSSASWSTSGLGGLEVYYRSFDADDRGPVGEVADELGLVATGGSDYHGDLGTYAEAHAELWVPPEVAATAPGRRRRLAGTAHDRPIDASTARCRCSSSCRRPRPRPGSRPRPTTTAWPSTCPEAAHPAALPRLDARLPDEPQRLGGDGRPPARRPAARRRQRSRRADLIVINTCAIREGAEQKVIGRQGQLARLKAANPGLRVVLTGCSVREPDRAGLRRRYPAVDLFLRPDEEPELVDRLGLASAQAPARSARSARRRDDGRRPDRRSASRTTCRHPRARGRGGDASPAGRRSAPGCRSSTAATRPAPTASCRSAAGRSGAGRSTTSSTRPARSPRPATARSRCSARTSTRTATTSRPEPRFGHVDAARWAGRRLDLARPAGPRRADPRHRRPAHRRRQAGDRAPAVRDLAPVGPVRSAHRGAGRLPIASASTSTCRSSPATTRSCGGWAASTRSSTTPSASRGSARPCPGITISTDIIVGFCGETEAQFEATLRAARDGPLRPGLRGGLLAAARHARRRTSPTTSRPTSSGAASTSCSRSRRGSVSSATRRGSAARSASWSTRSCRRAATTTTTRPRRHAAPTGPHCRAGPAATSSSISPARPALVGREVTVRIEHAGPYALRGVARRRRDDRSAAHRRRGPDRDRQDRPRDRPRRGAARERAAPPRSSRPIPARSSAASTSARPR